jgi:hypothetical protein
VIHGKRFRFAHNPYKRPPGTDSTYPKDFILVGDSVVKNAKSDTFYVIRGDQRWPYFLPIIEYAKLLNNGDE